MRSLHLRLGCLLALSLFGCKKNIPVPDVHAPSDAASIARGEYLASHVTSCLSCHSPRDWTRLAGPAVPSGAWAGGDDLGPYDLKEGSSLTPPNLTPAHLRDWSDGELVRAITTGMGRGEHPLFPSMPYFELKALAMDDALCIVAYLRTLPPSGGEVAERRLPFPLGIIVNVMPKPAQLRASRPAPGDADHGKYVTQISGCVWCHSAVDSRGRIVPDGELAGGHAFVIRPPGKGRVFSANLSADPTGLGPWTKEQFLARFRSEDAPVTPGGFNSVMPWVEYRGMTDADLGAIYDYLRTVPARQNTVVKYAPQ